jgi:Flp pilus assembly protein TadG
MKSGIIKQWLTDCRGNVAIIATLTAIPLMFAAFGIIELSSASGERASLQEAVDAGALAGAGRLSMANTAAQTPIDTAVTVAQQSAARSHLRSKATFSAAIDGKASTITVTGAADHKALIGFLGFGDTTLTAMATAENLGSVPLCVLQTGAGGIRLENNARIRATGCAIHANQNIRVKSSAMIQAERTQAVGTVEGPVSPAGNGGALPISDPFAALSLTPPQDCVGKPERITQKRGETLILPPGVHCEHFMIDKDATLILQPGDHYFMDDLEAHKNAVIKGDDVALIFGSTKKINFADRATVQLSARKSGPFAGFLIITTRDNHQVFSIASDNVSKLLGTIYIPDAELNIATTGNVAQDSAWSIIVADTLTMTKNPVLVINNGYAGSSVPVPQGVGPGYSAPVLSH